MSIQYKNVHSVNTTKTSPIRIFSVLYWPSYRSDACCIGQYEKHHVMIPLLINQSNISRDFSLELSKCLADISAQNGANTTKLLIFGKGSGENELIP
jgi:hypothetical protein